MIFGLKLKRIRYFDIILILGARKWMVEIVDPSGSKVKRKLRYELMEEAYYYDNVELKCKILAPACPAPRFDYPTSTKFALSDSGDWIIPLKTGLIRFPCKRLSLRFYQKIYY